KWWSAVSPEWSDTRDMTLKILQKEAELEEIVRLVGPESLPEDDKLILLAARMIREDFLMQSAYHPVDTYTTPQRAHMMLSTIMKFYELAQEMSTSGTLVSNIASSKTLQRISRMKDVPNEDFDKYVRGIRSEIEESMEVQEGEI
ncbi:unnamed protein product, partial [marine sediment metagenome]